MREGRTDPGTGPDDETIIRKVHDGDTGSFEILVTRYQHRVFAIARRHARRESEVEDIVQEVFLRAFRKLGTFRFKAPFEHWLMKMSVRTCYDFLRVHQRNREHSFSDFSDEDRSFLDSYVGEPEPDRHMADAARVLVHKVLERMSAPARMVITLQEIEGKSIREIADLTGWSVSLVKVRAFRARNEMRKLIAGMEKDLYL